MDLFLGSLDLVYLLNLDFPVDEDFLVGAVSLVDGLFSW